MEDSLTLGMYYIAAAIFIFIVAMGILYYTDDGADEEK